MTPTLSEELKTVEFEGTLDTEQLLPPIRYTNSVLASSASLLYIFAMGMTISYTAQATVDMKRPGSRLRNITADEITWIGSLNMLGGVPANVLAGFFTHTYGRKAVLMLTSPLFLCSWLMVAYAPTVGWLYAGKIISGFCTGLYIVAVPAYVSEIAPQSIRGLLSSGFALANNLGILVVMALGIVLRWSWLAMSLAVVITGAVCLMVFMPESPAWLVKESRIDEATENLKLLRGKQSDTTQEIQIIADSLSQKEEQRISFRDIRNPTLYKPMLISLCLMFFHTSSGAGPILVYTVEIFQNAGSTIAPTTAATIIAAVPIVANILCGSVIDKYGRRKLYIISGIGTTLTLTVLGAYSLVIKEYSVNQNLVGYMPIVCFIAYAFVFNLGLGSIPFITIPEMISIRFRSAVLSLSTVFLSFCSFVMIKIFDDLRSVLGDYGLYWFYAFFCFMSILFGYFALPETKNLSIEEISKSFIKATKKS